MICSCAIGYKWCGCCGCANNPKGPAHNHNGNPCKRQSIKGSFRCKTHSGGTAPAVSKAREELAMLRLPGIDTLWTVMETMERIVEQFGSNTCPTCGYPKGDPKEIQAVSGAAMVAAKTVATILDRTGIPPKAELTVKQSDGDLDLSLLTFDEKSEMIRVLAPYKALMQQIRTRISGQPAQAPALPPSPPNTTVM